MLDEPSLGLSPMLVHEIFGIILRIRDETGTAVLVVEQNAAVALKHGDDGYIMELGYRRRRYLRRPQRERGRARGLSGRGQRARGPIRHRPALETSQDLEMSR
ncbi:MAG: hypothetical protein H6898_12190 [Rhodobacter sp.]|nr:hypothetical protein [Rhodobacter sp.]